MITVTGAEAIGVGMTSAEKMRAMRARAKESGLCVTCAREEPRAGKATCAACNEAAKQRVYAQRERETKPQQPKKPKKPKSKASKKKA